MSEAAQVVSGSGAAAARDFQRETLEQIVTLTNECTAQEQRIEEERAHSLAKEEREFEQAVKNAKQRSSRKQSELSAAIREREQKILSRDESDRKALEAAHADALRQITRTRDQAESALKKQYEQTNWEAESEFVTFQMRMDAEEQRFNKEHEASLAELASLGTLETAALAALQRYGISAFPFDPAISEAMQGRIDIDPKAALVEHREKTGGLLKELQRLTQASALDDVVPFFTVVILAGVAAGIGWLVPQDNHTKLWSAGGAALGGIVVGVIAWIVLRHKRRVKITSRSKEVFVPLMQALTVAQKAATLDPEAAAAAREKKISEARRRRDQVQSTAREKAKGIQAEGAEQHRAAAGQENQRFQEEQVAIEDRKTRALSEMAEQRDKTTRQLDEEDAATRKESEERHAGVLASISARYESESNALTAKWNEGLRQVQELLASGSGYDPELLDWNSPAWDRWISPREYSGQFRFGEMKVNLAELTEHLPKRLKLPEAFTVPAMLAMPAHASLLVETGHAGRAAANDLARLVITRLLTQLPAGRAKFTIIDPVGLGQSFAGFMHLADHDESLVGSRIWTEKDHILQRLSDLTEHMETVIQKYLRNEYATIDQYNAQAGELAEPFRFLVISDFPAGFEQEALRRLSSIAMTGPRCGVYTIILRDIRQPLPPGTRMEEILTHSVHLVHKGNGFAWEDAVFKRFPLRIDTPPDEMKLTQLMEMVGKAAKEAKRVEVPFDSIAPGDGQFWSMSSRDDLRVPIGKSGATRRQSLRLGTGVAQHALVAGKTGSGKSNLMHTIVTNLAMWYGPDEVELYLVDFKKGVEFKAYVSSCLPHARAIAVESDREFGLSVLQRVDAELTRRGSLFRDVGVQDISGYREKTGQSLPRTLLLVDEFQEFFSEDDKISQESASLLDRLVRQGRAFGVHLVLGSQTIGGSAGLGRSTLGQIAVRVALQCSDADSQLILGDNNSAARLLTRPGEAIYNDAGGLIEANSPFQIAFLPDEEREVYLGRIREFAKQRAVVRQAPVVFEGNSAADIARNPRLTALLERPDYPPATSAVPAYIGEPVAIKEPTAVYFRRQPGMNVLTVGQQEESAIAIFSSMIASLAAQHKPGDAKFFLMDGSAVDSRYFGLLECVLGAIPHENRVVAWRAVPEAINELAELMADRQSREGASSPVYLLLFGLQRYRLLRRQEDDFSFGRSEDPPKPKTDKQFADLLAEGPGVGIHTIAWADTPVALERTLDRAAMRQFDHRIMFQMSASDSSNLIDSPLANRLGNHRGLLYSEEQGTIEKFRPYQVPDDAWLVRLAERLRRHSG